MDIGRKHDIETMKQDLKKADPVMRRNIEEAGDKIKREQGDGYLRSARESLIRAKLRGESDNARDISEQIFSHVRHQNDVPIGRRTFSFSFPDGFWSK